METLEIELSDGSSTEGCLVRFDEVGDDFAVVFSTVSLGNFETEQPDLFDALCRFREWLEPKGFRALCNGSRIDCYPSGMSRGGGGLKLYVLEMGHPATTILETFAPAPFDQIASVTEQQNFFDQWLASLGRQA